MEDQDLYRMRAEIDQQVRIHHNSKYPAIIIPFVHGTVTGFFLAFTAAVLAYYTAWLPWFPVFMVALPTVTTLVWIARIQHHQNMGDWLETITHKDWNGDGQIGNEQPPAVVEVRLTSEDGSQQQRAWLPASEEELHILAKGILQSNRPFSEEEWSGRGKPFSQGGIEKLRDEFIRRGWAFWINPDEHRAGVQFTEAGRAVLRQFARDAPAYRLTRRPHPPPSPTPRRYQ